MEDLEVHHKMEDEDLVEEMEMNDEAIDVIGRLRKENESLRAQIEAFERKFVEMERQHQQQIRQLRGEAGQAPAGDGTSARSTSSDDIVVLNVGGKYFSCLRSTLCRFEGTFLEALASGRHEASATKDELGCYFIDRDPAHFGLVLSFLRDQSFRIKPPVSASARAVRSRSGGASNTSEAKTTSLTGASPLILAAHGIQEGLRLPIDDDLRDTLSLVRELDYYGLLNYVLPREVGTELAQWSQDFAHVFTVESYHHKAASLWVDHLAREADVAENYYRKAIDLDLGTDDDDASSKDGSSKQQRYSRAVKYYHKAASLGHVGALFNLAVCHMDGDGVPADPSKAVRFLMKAAEAGHKQSQYQLALCYKQGKGIGSDKREAVYWFRQAASQGHTTAQAFLQDTTWQLGQKHLCAWE